ncbi:MAG TPA: DUF4105 domain-containing protein [Candidatus Binatia bacterium]|jgi:hypothetical protein|nr:DUF4105 domain-containing protein [Candidatus Binatia bacterium]
MRTVGRVLRGVATALAIGWAGLAVWLDGPRSWVAAGLAAVGAASLGLAVARARLRATFFWLAWLAVLGWWLAIPPRNDRAWQPDVARTSTADIRGDRLVVHDLGDFEWRSETDFTPRWEERAFDLSGIRGVDLFLSYWGPRLISHTIVSWEFADGRHLAISIETRKERDEEYSAIRGFFRQYELYYVVADEHDLVGLRGVRGERVFLYRLRADPVTAGHVLRSYVDAANRLARRPAWYNALTRNCTTTIRLHVLDAGRPATWDWRVLANGRLDELLYERGAIDRTRPFPALRAASDVTVRAADPRAFSAEIREGLPPRPPPGADRPGAVGLSPSRCRGSRGSRGSCRRSARR